MSADREINLSTEYDESLAATELYRDLFNFENRRTHL